jgi:hypothetical protein
MDRIVLVAEPGLIPPREQAGARRGTNRIRDIAVRAGHARTSELVKMGRNGHLAAMEPIVGIAEIVAKED